MTTAHASSSLVGDVAGSFALDTPPEWNRMIPVIVTAAATLSLT